MLSVAVVAGAIIRQWTDNFDPSTYHDRHQEALQLLEAEVRAERARYAAAAAARDFHTAVVYTGEAIDMIHSIEPAEAILPRVVAGAEAALARRFD
jgi:non-homologous end joining protein Ku